jgi:hypothetical protein
MYRRGQAHRAQIDSYVRPSPRQALKQGTMAQFRGFGMLWLVTIGIVSQFFPRMM